jgi:hypothetical protein
VTRRALVLALLVLASPVAVARVIMQPSIAHSCGFQKTWDAVASCVKRFGTMKLERSRDDAKLFRVTPGEGQWGTEGIYLFAKSNQGWRLVGQFLDNDVRVVGFSTPTFSGKKVYRVDLLHAANQDVSVDEVSTRRGYVRRATSLYCGGVVSSCAQVVTSCDVFVGGKLLETFRGTPRYTQNGIVEVDGDFTRAGHECATEEQNLIELPGRSEIEDPLF